MTAYYLKELRQAGHGITWSFTALLGTGAVLALANLQWWDGGALAAGAALWWWGGRRSYSIQVEIDDSTIRVVNTFQTRVVARIDADRFSVRVTFDGRAVGYLLMKTGERVSLAAMVGGRGASFTRDVREQVASMNAAIGVVDHLVEDSERGAHQ
jgi:hypothetical protein